MRIATIISLVIIFFSTSYSFAEKYVRHIDIIRKNVFDNELEQTSNFIYKIANNIHVVTRDRVIRREILLKPGDPFNVEQLKVSMRNIRSLGFIGDASVKTIEVPPDSVDIEIITEDLWTTVAGISSEGGGGLYNITAYAEEKNIAGLGIGLQVEATFASDDNDGFLIYAYDSRVLGSRNTINVIYSDFEFNTLRHLSLYRPLYSVDTRYTYSINLQSDELTPRIFYQGDEVYRYNSDVTHADFSVGRAFGAYTRVIPYLFYHYTKYDYELYPGYPDWGIVPEDETLSGPGLGFTLNTFRYLTARYLDEFGTTEDLTEHATLNTIVLWSGPTFDATNMFTTLQVETSFLYQPFDFMYTGFRNTYSSLYDGDLHRDRISNTVRATMYVKPSTYHLFAARVISQFAWRQKSNYQLTLGGNSGLRGYPDRYFSGNRLFLSNVEYRLFTPVEIYTVNFGGAVFFDAGNVWRSSENIKVNDLKTNVGIGLRLGLTKSSTARIIRVDLAKALNDDNWYLSFGTENIFDLGRYQ